MDAILWATYSNSYQGKQIYESNKQYDNIGAYSRLSAKTINKPLSELNGHLYYWCTYEPHGLNELRIHCLLTLAVLTKHIICTFLKTKRYWQLNASRQRSGVFKYTHSYGSHTQEPTASTPSLFITLGVTNYLVFTHIEFSSIMPIINAF